MVVVNCRRGKSCVEPPNDAPVVAWIRISHDTPEKCILNPVATWFHLCHPRGGTKVPCDQFKEIIELFLRKYRGYAGGAVLYAIHCHEFGLCWYAIFDHSWDGYCGDVAVVDLLDDCIFL